MKTPEEIKTRIEELEKKKQEAVTSYNHAITTREESLYRDTVIAILDQISTLKWVLRPSNETDQKT